MKETVVKKAKTFWMRTSEECILAVAIAPEREAPSGWLSGAGLEGVGPACQG